MKPSIDRPLPPMPLQSVSSRRSSEEPTKESFGGGDHRTDCSKEVADPSAVLFDAALKKAGINSKWVAAHLQVSESLVSKWRSPNYSECPSRLQEARLPVSYHWAIHCVNSKHYGFAKRALAQVMEALGAMALAVEP